jgi:hypothetical protein
MRGGVIFWREIVWWLMRENWGENPRCCEVSFSKEGLLDR